MTWLFSLLVVEAAMVSNLQGVTIQDDIREGIEMFNVEGGRSVHTNKLENMLHGMKLMAQQIKDAAEGKPSKVHIGGTMLDLANKDQMALVIGQVKKLKETLRQYAISVPMFNGAKNLMDEAIEYEHEHGPFHK